jgi:putative membrane protein
VTSPLPADPPHGPVAADLAGGWHRLHPLTPLVRAGNRLFALVVVLAGIAVANQRQDRDQIIPDLVIIALALSGGFVSWLVTRWQVADGVLRIDTGLIRRDSRRFPLSQIQAIDVVQSGLARVLGLAALQLRVAGGDASRGGRLACLRLADAERLRAELLAASGASATTTTAGTAGVVAATGAGTTGAGTAGAAAAGAGATGAGTTGAGTAGAATGALAGQEPGPVAGVTGGDALVRPADGTPERELFRVRPGQLAAAIALSRPAAIALAVIGGVTAFVAITGKSAATASFLPTAIGIVLTVWRWFNGEYGTTVAAAPDGLRLRSGLIQTTAETIRPGRVQAVRLVEPLAWRPFGWCRLEVDVAGPRVRRESRAEHERLRAVIPVGTRPQAMEMLGAVLSSRPLPDKPAPRRARLKAPLAYHFLAFGSDDRYVVTSRGRVTRTTTWIPLEKVQSIRWVQGPVQRCLGLSSVRLDVAGKRLTGEIEDRTDAEARDLLRRLPDLARAARARAG